MGNPESPRNFQARGEINQRIAKAARESEARVFGNPSKKMQRAERNRIFHEQIVQTSFNKALDNVASGQPTLEDVSFIRNHQDVFPATDGASFVDSITSLKDRIYS